MNLQNLHKKSPDLLLDSNHTHFLLFDDGTQSEFTKDIKFRVNFENELRKGYNLHYYENRNTQSKLSNLNSPAQVINQSLLHRNSSITYDSSNSQIESIPFIAIVVQGGLITLKLVEEYLNLDLPILILAVCLFFVFEKFIIYYLKPFLRRLKDVLIC